MLRRLVEVKNALMSMVVGPTWAEWRQADSKKGSMVRRVLVDEDWWSKIDFLLKFTSSTFDLLRVANIEKPLLGERFMMAWILWLKTLCKFYTGGSHSSFCGF